MTAPRSHDTAPPRSRRWRWSRQQSCERRGGRTSVRPAPAASAAAAAGERPAGPEAQLGWGEPSRGRLPRSRGTGRAWGKPQGVGEPRGSATSPPGGAAPPPPSSGGYCHASHVLRVACLTFVCHTGVWACTQLCARLRATHIRDVHVPACLLHASAHPLCVCLHASGAHGTGTHWLACLGFCEYWHISVTHVCYMCLYTPCACLHSCGAHGIGMPLDM